MRARRDAGSCSHRHLLVAAAREVQDGHGQPSETPDRRLRIDALDAVASRLLEVLDAGDGSSHPRSARAACPAGIAVVRGADLDGASGDVEERLIGWGSVGTYCRPSLPALPDTTHDEPIERYRIAPRGPSRGRVPHAGRGGAYAGRLRRRAVSLRRPAAEPSRGRGGGKSPASPRRFGRACAALLDSARGDDYSRWKRQRDHIRRDNGASASPGGGPDRTR